MNQTDTSEVHNRRDVITGTGKIIAAGAVATLLGAALPLQARASSGSNIGKKCMTILYPNTDNVRFDFEYYKNHHLPLIMKLYNKAISKFELRKGLPAPDGTKPPYVATINIYIADQQAFDEAGAQHGQTLVDDVPNFSNVLPIFQQDEIYEIAE